MITNMAGEPIDPWTSLHLRARALDLCSRELRDPGLARQRSAFFAWLGKNGWLDELGLRPKPPAETMPWADPPPAPGSALHLFHTAFQAMYPPSFEKGLLRLRGGVLDSDAVEAAVVFLEADPWCFRSGYIKERICRYLRHVPIGDVHRARLQQAIIDVIKARPRREFRHYVGLAKLLDDPAFRERLRVLGASRYLDPGSPPKSGWTTQDRANAMLSAIIRANGV